MHTNYNLYIKNIHAFNFEKSLHTSTFYSDKFLKHKLN